MLDGLEGMLGFWDAEGWDGLGWDGCAGQKGRNGEFGGFYGLVWVGCVGGLYVNGYVSCTRCCMIVSAYDFMVGVVDVGGAVDL